jgi:short-subunit dehydrogenase
MIPSLNPKYHQWQGARVWIIGAGSGIGAALCRQLQAQSAKLALSGRRAEALEQVATTNDTLLPLDATDPAALAAAHDRLLQQWGGIDLVIYCAGTYSPMRAWEVDLKRVEQTFAINLSGAYNLLAAAVPAMIKRRHGGICLVASVAGYTGLPKALAYGPSKAALINLAEVLYSDLNPKGIGVYLVNPGFVDTRLTKQNDFDMPALITPDSAASKILRGLERGRFEIHFPRRFTLWMKLLAALPRRWRFALLKRAVQ